MRHPEKQPLIPASFLFLVLDLDLHFPALLVALDLNPPARSIHIQHLFFLFAGCQPEEEGASAYQYTRDQGGIHGDSLGLFHGSLPQGTRLNTKTHLTNIH